MAGGQERVLRRRIRSVEATKKITRAFELIAASQMVRAQGRIAGSRPYVEGIGRVLAVTAADSPGGSRLLGSPEAPGRVAVVAIASDRGLCGAYNSTVLRRTERLLAEGEAQGRSYRLVTVGRRAQSYFRFRGRRIDCALTHVTDRPTFADARRVAHEVVPPFLAGEVDLVELVSTRFVSAGLQRVEVRQLLPLVPPEGVLHRDGPPAGFYDFEPGPADLLELLVPQYAEAEVFQALLEASASEHTARQRAMAAATENAEEFIVNLRRVMNRVRQEAITTEIMEIVGGAEALRRAAGAERAVAIPYSEE
ncbi:MAG TPA: ATP synthase F1 subunit gamma [Acidimicrobiales bacterium]|jgi:F-type H+-transporting ATPase subunit gamma|nr:ATP synthase F1 subunit gamma [Acidimicrobiales bacterium]